MHICAYPSWTLRTSPLRPPEGQHEGNSLDVERGGNKASSVRGKAEGVRRDKRGGGRQGKEPGNEGEGRSRG